jgi:hypothetical protein
VSGTCELGRDCGCGTPDERGCGTPDARGWGHPFDTNINAHLCSPQDQTDFFLILEEGKDQLIVWAPDDGGGGGSLGAIAQPSIEREKPVS